MVELTLIQKICVWALPVLFAITLHEVAHGWAALLFGDQTAKWAGRLTINPLKHIDLIGTIIVPVLLLASTHFIFGWAKPVPVDARNMRNPRFNMIIVALAGPCSNFLMALLWAAVAKLGLYSSPWFGAPLVYMGQAGIIINVALGVVNCLPLLPLDGGRVLYHVLSGKAAWWFYRLEPYGILIFFALMLTHVLFYILVPPIQWITGWIITLFGLM